MKKSYIDSRKNEIIVDKTVRKDALLHENQLLKAYLKEKLQLSEQKIKEICQKTEIALPISIFQNKLSSLEVVVKYLKEHQQLNFAAIARILNRDERTVWHAYQRSVQKKYHLNIVDSEITIPVSQFSERKYAPLEVVVAFLKDSHSLTFTDIAALLDRSPKTVWTIYQRIQKKNAN